MTAPLEPFGYFRATPFGWEDCAETDEGAKALYEITPDQALEALGWFSRLEIAQERIAELNNIAEDQRLALEALNIDVGGKGSCTTDNLTRIARLEAERDRLILAVADHVSVRCEYKRVQGVLVEALKSLSFAAQTTGGTAGRDDALDKAITEARAALAAVKPSPFVPPKPNHQIQSLIEAARCLGVAQAKGEYTQLWESVIADLSAALNAAVQPDSKSSKLPYTCFSNDDGDRWLDTPDDIEFVDGLQVGDQFELLAGWRADRVTFQVTKVPDGESDDYAVEPVKPAGQGKGAK